MEKFESRIESRVEEEERRYGVLGHHIENNHYVVDIRWKDGKVVEEHFPVIGFPVVDLKTGEKLGHIDGKRALKILEENASEMTIDEFSWLNFVGQEVKNKK